MKDIKERVRDKNPKIRNPAARLPKELVRSAVLEAKEKPRELHEKSSGQSESPTQYGTEKIESVQYRAASVAGKSIGKTTYQGGKKLAGVTYRKIKERKLRFTGKKLFLVIGSVGDILTSAKINTETTKKIGIIWSNLFPMYLTT